MNYIEGSIAEHLVNEGKIEERENRNLEIVNKGLKMGLDISMIAEIAGLSILEVKMIIKELGLEK